MSDSLQLMAEDLKRSGLLQGEIKSRLIENPERAATNTPFHITGYIIPYFDINGVNASFYRARLFDHDPKYKQPKETPSHVYFPPDFLKVAQKCDYVIITEGEKKAALATKLGFPTCALGGVDSWRNRTLVMPNEAELNADKKRIRVKIPSGSEATEEYLSPLAKGIQELIDWLLQGNRHLFIAFDTDGQTVKTDVQRAAASMAFELRFRGVPFNRIRQLHLPRVGDKTGLDDFLLAVGPDKLGELIATAKKARSLFPRHPNIRDYINKRLQRPKLTRKETQQVSTAILSDLDANGIRLRAPDLGQAYYFDYTTKKLIKVTFDTDTQANADSAFGQFLYRRYGLSAADARLTVWLGAQFTGEDPIEDVSPYRVIARPDQQDCTVTYQLSDGNFAKVGGREVGTDGFPGLTVFDNGEDGVLFEAEQVKPIELDTFLAEYQKRASEPVRFWWAEVLNDVRLKDKDKGRYITALLFYLTPWLQRWRGMQCPVEIILGEAGSGKSTLLELRLGILTGDPKLRNAPQDMKDWHASAANTGGLHVTDNLQLIDRVLRQRLSDELCRLVTEGNPYIEMRKYYTNADLMRIPVRCTFGITAIQQPFLNADILQRSIVIELDKAQDMVNGELTYNSNWLGQQMQRYGGREAWVSHHLYVLHKFFCLVEKEWRYNYKAKHRLINFEQAMIMMARVFGLQEPEKWIPQYLSQSTDKQVVEADWAFEGIREFCLWRYGAAKDRTKIRFPAQAIADWATGTDEFKDCEALTNSRRLGRYLKFHKSQLGSMCGLYEDGTQNNRQMFKIVPKEKA